MNNGAPVKTVTSLTGVLEPNSYYIVGTSLFYIDNRGKAVQIGSNPIVGQTTLVAGTKAITAAGTLTTSKAFLQVVSPLTASLTVDIQAVCTANTLTITALLAAKTINAADVSIVNYIIYQ